MTSLQNLQAEARKKFKDGLYVPSEHRINGPEFDAVNLDEFISNIYTEALQEALGKVREPENCFEGDQALKGEIAVGIMSLIPKKNI